MTVAELLARTSSRELSEWAAYERHAGPLGSSWRDEALAAIHEELQKLQYLIGAVNTEKNKENPVPEPKRYPRPNDWQDPDDTEEE